MNGIWAMTDTKFDEAIREAKEAAWDEGHNHCFRVENPANTKPYNPYRSAE
jgi:hypothetical protein